MASNNQLDFIHDRTDNQTKDALGITLVIAALLTLTHGEHYLIALALTNNPVLAHRLALITNIAELYVLNKIVVAAKNGLDTN